MVSLSGFFAAGSASAAGFIQCSLLLNTTVNSEAGNNCVVQDKLFQFTGASSDAVDLSGVLNSPAGITFAGSPEILAGPIDIEYMVSVLDPFNGSPNPLAINALTIASLIDQTGVGTLGGTVDLCVGGSGFNGAFTGPDDGCAANGGALFSMGLSSGNVFNFFPTTTEVGVWDHLTLASGAGFGSLGQTFTQTPEPISAILIGSGIMALGIFRRRRSN